MIDVNYGYNQGDAHLLISDGSTTMIDAGYYEEAMKKVVPYLDKIGIKSIDHFFISHPHLDHYEGMEAIQNKGISIKNVYYNMPPADVKDCCYNQSHFIKYVNAAEARGAKLHDIKKGFKLALSRHSVVEVLHAETAIKINKKNIDVNDMSLIMKWRVKDWSVLFAGDLNHNIGSYLATDKRMKADILKVPHHGGYGIAPKLFFNNVNPKMAMFPAPAWIYEGTRGIIATSFSVDEGLPHCVNGINGTILLKFGEEITVSSEKPNQFCKNGILNFSKDVE